MTGEARALANILLDHHRRICQPRALTRNYDVHECTSHTETSARQQAFPG